MGRPLDKDIIIKILERWQKAFKENSHYVSASDLSLVIKDVRELPTIQSVATDICVGDTISRQAAIDAVNNAFDRETLLTGFVRSIAVRAIRDMPSAQPEPSIPLSWIEKYIEWLKSLDNEFTKLAAAHISVMVKKWRDEQNER